MAVVHPVMVLDRADIEALLRALGADERSAWHLDREDYQRLARCGALGLVTDMQTIACADDAGDR
jgi:hypothetical protein